MQGRKLFVTTIFLCISLITHASVFLHYHQPEPIMGMSLEEVLAGPSDDFNDNSTGDLWAVSEEDAGNCYVLEDNQRLEVLATGTTAEDLRAAYDSRLWAMNATQDFSLKVNYHYSPAVGPDGGILLCLAPNRVDPQHKNVSFYAGYDNLRYISYGITEQSVVTESDWAERTTDDGVLYISYVAATDTLYLSGTNYGSGDALFTITGLLQGEWGGAPVYAGVGGFSKGVALASGDAHLDDFVVESGTIVEIPLLVTEPTGSRMWAAGQTYSIEWETDNVTANVRILLFKGGLKVGALVKSTPNDGSWSWTIPTTQALGDDYRIRVIGVEDTSVSGFSELFEICRPGDLYTPIEVTDPNSSAVWLMGTEYPIQWTGGEPGAAVAIKLFKAGTIAATVQATTPNDGQFLWTVPYTLTAGTDYRVKVMSRDYGYVADFSDYFEIAIPPMRILQPNGGETVPSVSDYEIRWTPGPADGHVKIQLLTGAGTVFKTLIASTPDDGSWMWSIPVTQALGEYQIRIISGETSTRRDVSNAVFEIVYNYDRTSYTLEELRRYNVLGEQWSYSSYTEVSITSPFGNDSYSGTYPVSIDVLPTYQNIGGHQCNVIRSVCDGDTTQMAWYTDASGVHFQKWIMESDVGTMTMDMRGVVIAPQLLAVGTVYKHSGTIGGTFALDIDGDTLTGSISGTSSVSMQLVGWQNVTVPYGTFKAMKIKQTVSVPNAVITFNGLGRLSFSTALTETVWGVPYLGIIKDQSIITQRFSDGYDTINARVSGLAQLTNH